MSSSFSGLKPNTFCHLHLSLTGIAGARSGLTRPDRSNRISFQIRKRESSRQISLCSKNAPLSVRPSDQSDRSSASSVVVSSSGRCEATGSVAPLPSDTLGYAE